MGPPAWCSEPSSPTLDRTWPSKIFNEHIAADPVFVRGFEAEAQRAAVLEHPHIVPIHDYWREPGRAFVASRYLRGGSLRALTERGEGFEPARALRVLEQVASALAYAHALGVTHGRVTPANILLDDEGNAYLADFPVGVARSTEPASDVNELGELGRALLGEGAPSGVGRLLDRDDPRAGAPSARAIAEAARAALIRRRPRGLPVASCGTPTRGYGRSPEADAGDFFGPSALVGRLLGRADRHGPGVPVPRGGGALAGAGSRPPSVPDSCRRSGGRLGDPAERLVAEMYPGAHPLDELEAAIVRVAARQTGLGPRAAARELARTPRDG